MSCWKLRVANTASARRLRGLKPARGHSDDDGVHTSHTARAAAGRQRVRQAGELNEDSDPDTAGSKFERENRLRNRAGGPNGIRAVVGLDLTFSIRGVAIRHKRTPPPTRFCTRVGLV